jgi:hypothetical protein
MILMLLCATYAQQHKINSLIYHQIQYFIGYLITSVLVSKALKGILFLCSK